MIELSDEAQSVLTRSHRRYLAVESWREDELLADAIPVSIGQEEGDRAMRVPERVILTVPRLDRGASWSPVTDDHPLAANGQRLRVQVGIGLGNGVVEWFQRGWFLVQETTTDGDTVNVEAVGLLTLVDEARLVSPYQPSGTLVSTLRGLVEPAVTVVVDAGVSDRAVPSGVNYDEDRLGAVLELLDAWPAEAAVNEDGYLYVAPATVDSTPVLTLTNGSGGTVIKATGSSGREGAYNAVVARGTASDGGQVQGAAYDYSGGPKRYGGPFNPLPVPFFYSSPLLTTVAQCKAAAATVLRRKLREVARTFDVEMVPHPALQLGDVVAVTTDDVTALPCTVEAMRLPLTPGGGSQTLTVREVP